MNAKGWIIYNGNLPGEKFLDFAEMIQTAAAKQNSETIIYKNNELLSMLTQKSLELIPGRTLPDYVVFTDKDIYLARQLELLGIPVFNRSKAIETSDDKIATYQQLGWKKLPIPDTIIAPKIFAKGTLDKDLFSVVIEKLGLPMIVKEAFGSFGEQVYLIHSKEELINKAVALQGKPFLFQKFISSSFGTDLRLQVVGDEVVAAMKRHSSNDFRANITAGGSMEAYHPTNEEKKLAVKAANAVDADFAGVDLLLGSDGSPLICEINSNAHIRNLYECTNINAANFMMEYVLQQVHKKE